MQTCDLSLFEWARETSEEDLLLALDGLTTSEHSVLSRVLVLLGEIDKPQIYRDRACPSLFVFCMSRFKYSEGQAYRRISAARAIKKFPRLLSLFIERQISLTNLATIAKRLTNENHLALALEVGLERRGKVEKILARWFPQPDAPASIRKIPDATSSTRGIPPTPTAQMTLMHATAEQAMPTTQATTTTATPTTATTTATATRTTPTTATIPISISPMTVPPTPEAPSVRAPISMTVASPAPVALPVSPIVTSSLPRQTLPREMQPRITPTSEGRYRVKFNVDEETCQLLEHAQRLTSHRKNGDLDSLLKRAIALLHAELEKERLGKTSRPQKNPRPMKDARDVPRSVRRQVFERDREQCTFVDAEGHRCPAREHLELDHIIPRAKGGRGTVENTRLRCRAHNLHAAEQSFGKDHIARKIRERRAATSSATVLARSLRPTPTAGNSNNSNDSNDSNDNVSNRSNVSNGSDATNSSDASSTRDRQRLGRTNTRSIEETNAAMPAAIAIARVSAARTPDRLRSPRGESSGPRTKETKAAVPAAIAVAKDSAAARKRDLFESTPSHAAIAVAKDSAAARTRDLFESTPTHAAIAIAKDSAAARTRGRDTNRRR